MHAPHRIVTGLVVLGLLTSPLTLTGRAASPAVERALSQFLAAASTADAAAAAEAAVKAGATFDDALAAVTRGRTYPAEVPRGLVRLTHRVGSVDYPYTLEVPQTYDPAKRYQVRVQLHGGVGRPEAAPRNGIGALAGAEQIYVLPTAWSAAEWWTDGQLENLRGILDRVKRTYNVDENRVVMSGVSDGGTGTYYFSMRDTTPFAAFLPLNGAVAVLRNQSLKRDGDLFPNNFTNKPFFIVNGGRDPLYPTSLVEPYIEQMVRGGVTVTYLPQPDAVHNTAWWPQVKDTYERFVTAHPRAPHPDRLSWESDLTAGTGRAHWLVIDTLGPPRPEAVRLPDVNDIASAPEANFGIRADGTTVTAVSAGSNAASFGLLPGDVITKIGERVIPPPVDVVDLLSINDPGSALVLTIRRDGALRELRGTYAPATAPRITSTFTHRGPSARVDAVRTGNTVALTTRRVGRLTLLVSPDAFDLSQPITVTADGRQLFSGRVTPSVATLLKWAARDNDRTMLYAAEVPLVIE